METKTAIGTLEAVLFAIAQPISAQKLSELTGIELPTVHSLLQIIGERLEREKSGIELLKLEDRYQLATRKDYSKVVENALISRRNQPLSQAANEVLAIVAYNQPVTRAFIEQIRGVDSASSVSNLLSKGLIAEFGRLDLPGRPIGLVTTDLFLRSYGLQSLSELPKVAHDEPDESDDEPDELL